MKYALISLLVIQGGLFLYLAFLLTWKLRLKLTWWLEDRDEIRRSSKFST